MLACLVQLMIALFQLLFSEEISRKLAYNETSQQNSGSQSRGVKGGGPCGEANRAFGRIKDEANSTLDFAIVSVLMFL